MGAVKRTHRSSRIDQQVKKLINKICDKHHIRPRDADMYMKLMRPDWYNELCRMLETAINRMMEVAIPEINKLINDSLEENDEHL